MRPKGIEPALTAPTTPRRRLLHVFPTFAVGGAQVRFTAIANRFGDRFRHLVIAMDGNDHCRERLCPGLSVAVMHGTGRKGVILGNRRVFRRQLREIAPDVLVTHNWGSIEWAMANLPRLARHIHIEDGFGPEELAGQLPRRVLTRRVVLRRSMVALPSKNLVRIATDIWRLPSGHVHYIPNGIDLGRFAPRPGSALMATEPVIGAVAALRPEKNLARLLRAFAIAIQATEAELVIVGDGPERPALERLAGELGVRERVRFTGHVTDPAPLYAGFDLLALSSDTEQMPLSVIEAMAAGLPVAGTDVGDVREMLAPENQAFIGPADDDALAGRLSSLLRDPGLRMRLGAANRARAERDYQQETMFEAYAALFEGEG